MKECSTCGSTGRVRCSEPGRVFYRCSYCAREIYPKSKKDLLAKSLEGARKMNDEILELKKKLLKIETRLDHDFSNSNKVGE